MGTGYIDLHCHWVSGIDDGARSTQESAELLAGLARLGFTEVVATPHMRSGMFDNSAADLTRAYEACVTALGSAASVVTTSLSCEHYLDDVVLGRLLSGDGCPYPGAKAVLVECPGAESLPWLCSPLRNLVRLGMRPIVAHPERLRPLWRDPERLEELTACGAANLLDLASLVGTYGRGAMQCAWRLLELGLYAAACSDAHGPVDLAHVAAGLGELRARQGAETVESLLAEGPRALLSGEPR